MPQFDLIATSTFGLENVVARELNQLGYEDCRVSDGRVVFRGDQHDIARCNLWLRSADRLLIRVGEFFAPDFGALFDQTTALPWADLLPVDARFPVKGRSVRSRLHAVPKVQGVTKKAIVEAMKKKHNRFRFDESDALYQIEVAIVKDTATLTIDTTGPGLHKRGYRKVVGAAPLRETMAAGLIQLSYWNASRPLIDPFCGSGTIPIEAALIGQNIAPGLQRSFAAEDFRWCDRKVWKEARTEARDLKQREPAGPIMAFDHDPSAIRLAERGATDAGVGASIRFQCEEVSELQTNLEYGCIITNPPYGERLGENEEVEAVYRVMGSVFAQLPTWSYYVLTSYRGFEHLFGRRADRRRKLYNGRLECQFYQYAGPRPPRSEDVESQDDDHLATPATSEPPAADATAQASAPAHQHNTSHVAQTTPVDLPTNADIPAPAIDPFQTFIADCSTAPTTADSPASKSSPQNSSSAASHKAP